MSRLISEQSNFQYNAKDYSFIEMTEENISALIRERYAFHPIEINELFHIYMDLDILIEQCQCSFKETEKMVLNFYIEGYDEKHIAEMLDWQKKRQDDHGTMIYIPNEGKVKNTLRSICKKLHKRIKDNYQDWLEINGYVKISDDAQYFRCRVCGRDRELKHFGYDQLFNSSEQYMKCSDCV